MTTFDTRAEVTTRADVSAKAESRAHFHDVLRTLSEGSVNRSFDAYGDIDWDGPGMEVDRTDRRWILPSAIDGLASTQWYQEQTVERQIEIGMWRQANVVKVGLQFENILIRGLQHYTFKLANFNPEFRYCVHEAKEECNHTLMFQELVNRIGIDVPGMPYAMRKLHWLIPLAAGPFKIAFWFGILGGEEPIDHIQKAMLRSDVDLPPVLTRVMQIHVAEEARHISFAHEFIENRILATGPVMRWLLQISTPITMRLLCNWIARPPRAMKNEFNIPTDVWREAYVKGPEWRNLLVEVFGDIRKLVTDVGLMGRTGKIVWKLCRISGKPSRFRSQPSHYLNAA